MKSTSVNTEMARLTIGQVAKQAGIGLETVRFYEREGLIDKPPRTEAGYRQYPNIAVKRIRFIKRAKDLGFSLKEISELLSLRVSPNKTCRNVKGQTQTKISEIENKILALQRMKRALKKLESACSGKGPTSECPILDHLEKMGDA